MGAPGRAAFRIFVLLLGIWTGSAFHETAATSFAWHADPVAWASRPAWPGLVNPWPFSTMALLLATLAAGIAAWRDRGPGRQAALVATGGTALILAATLAWFVPQLGVMFGEGGTLDDAALVARSRTWIMLNLVRFAALIALFFTALVALGRIGR